MVYIAADDTLADFAVGSLQQLRRVAGQDGVVVVAQFDANAQGNIPRLVFDGSANDSQSLQVSKRESIPSDTVMVNPRALTNFINWAYQENPAEHYCLVLWGHGPELLAADYPDLRDGQKAKKFLAPQDVRKGVEDSKLIKDDHKKFAIVAFDACNMSLAEFAWEIADLAEFLVTSQDNVPDFSFPYDRMLLFDGFQRGDQIVEMCRKFPERYINAYEDYTLTKSSPTENLTLTTMSLQNAVTLNDRLCQLSHALLTITDAEKRKAVMNARANSQSFVLGLYVDLHDFCDALISELYGRRIDDQALIDVCQSICDAIQARGRDAFILANKVSANEHCRGISLYFPYSAVPTTSAAAQGGGESLSQKGTDAQRQGNENLQDKAEAGQENGAETIHKNGREVKERSVDFARQTQSQPGFESKGGPELDSKGGPELDSKGGPELDSKVLAQMRRQRIQDTEQNYGSLKFSQKTGWHEFIQRGWSRWLVEHAAAKVLSPDEANATDLTGLLNQLYSAQQAAFNLLSVCRELEPKKETRLAHPGGEQDGGDCEAPNRPVN